MNNDEQIFNIIIEVLRHVKSVEEEVKVKSLDAALAFGEALKQDKIKPSSDLLCALQYQDIMSQQLSATSEAIDSIDKALTSWLESYSFSNIKLQEGLNNLDNRLKVSLEDARKKKAAFSGRQDLSQNTEVEFF